MASQHHLELLSSGKTLWDRWRRKYSDVQAFEQTSTELIFTKPIYAELISTEQILRRPICRKQTCEKQTYAIPISGEPI